ncbi:MAG: sulfur carrier protein ThiS [Bacteroidetes bacterium]|nr:sulfur carrier protein ThiS [Bacteroidota bacterium]
MELHVNGKTRTIKAANPSITSYLQEYEQILPTEKGVAVALNGQVVPRSEWTATSLKSGDVIEIVRAFQGG